MQRDEKALMKPFPHNGLNGLQHKHISMQHVKYARVLLFEVLNPIGKAELHVMRKLLFSFSITNHT